jgi:hypothetical protein
VKMTAHPNTTIVYLILTQPGPGKTVSHRDLLSFEYAFRPMGRHTGKNLLSKHSSPVDERSVIKCHGIAGSVLICPRVARPYQPTWQELEIGSCRGHFIYRTLFGRDQGYRLTGTAPEQQTRYVRTVFCLQVD